MKINDNQDLLSFLDQERACVLSVLTNDNKVHSAAILFATDEAVEKCYFTTDKTSEKCQPLVNGVSSIPAAIVIGTIVGTPYTVQLKGDLRLVLPSQTNHSKKLSYLIHKHGNNDNKHWNNEMVLLEFEPQHGKFTDYSIDWTANELDFS